jgi:Na+-transporting NADH:ubiquinone oxidoreductase subunit NqrA
MNVSAQIYHHFMVCILKEGLFRFYFVYVNKGNNKITELRTILQRESQNS